MEANAPGDAVQAAAQPGRGKCKRHLPPVDQKWWFYQLTQHEPDLPIFLLIRSTAALCKCCYSQLFIPFARAVERSQWTAFRITGYHTRQES